MSFKTLKFLITGEKNQFINFPTARFESLVIQELADEVLICDTTTFRAFCLNKTAAEVWRHCDGKNDVRQIAVLLSKKLGGPVSEDFVWLALDQLSKENLLLDALSLSEKFGGISRREVIRRVCLASAIALPVISSLMMPTAAVAQSGVLPVGAACSENSECEFCCNTGGTGTCRSEADCKAKCGISQPCPSGFTCCNPSSPRNGGTCSSSGEC